jgi:multiple sugar transport system substrate-binding protein
MTIRLDRRQFLAGSSALAGAAAMGLRPAFAADSSLRLIWWGTQERANRTDKVTALYDKANAGTKTQGEWYTWNDYWPKLATEVAGGNSPDVIQMDYRYIVEYADRKAIAPLDDFIGDSLKLDDFDKDQIEGGKVNGKLYGISLGANSVAQMINVDAFSKVGVDQPGPDTSYEDWPKIGEAFNKANIGMKAFSDGSGVEPALENWLRQQGKALYTSDGKLAFDADDMVNWFKMWKDFRDQGIIVSPDDQALDTGPVDQTMIILGKAAQTFSNSNQLVAFQALTKAKMTITNYPRIKPGSKGGHYRKPSMFFSVGGQSKAASDAAGYISFFVNNVDANKVLGVERGIPCSASVRDAIAPTLNPQDQIALHFVANLGDLLGPLPPSPPSNAGEVATHLLTKSQEVAFGQSSPEDAGPAFVGEAKDILSRKG